MTDSMKALSVIAPLKMDLVSLDRPRPGVGEVLVRVAYCGICGSDYPRYFEGAVHAFPQTLGHEFSGIAETVGPDVTSIATGDRVVAAPLVPCMTCEQCQRGRPALCTRYSFVGSRQQGALAEYVSVPARNLVRIPDSLSLQDAALVEPLTVAIHGVERAALRTGARVAVYGAGVIGLLTIMVLKARGAGHVVAIDVQEDRLALARGLGADETVLGVGTGTADYFARHEAPEVVIETAGHPATQVASITHCAKGGSVVFIGTSHREVTFPPEGFEKILRGELNVTGSWMSFSAPFPGHEWTSAVQMIDSGAVNVKPLISGVYRLADGARPFEDIRAAKGAMLKVLYKPGEDLS